MDVLVDAIGWVFGAWWRLVLVIVLMVAQLALSQVVFGWLCRVFRV